MRYINWNIKCKSNTEKINWLIEKTTVPTECIIALEEVTPKAAEVIKSYFEKDYHIEYSLNYRKAGEFDSDNRRLGVMILVSKDIRVIGAGVYERNIFPERTLGVSVEYQGKTLSVAALHSITGVSFKMAKAVQFRTFAEYINAHKPDIVSFDANEPKIDHYDITKMEFFDQGQGEGGQGARLFFETLGKQRLRDVMSDGYDTSKYVYGEPLAVSHIINSTKRKQRYDFVFAKKDIKVEMVSYVYDEAIDATSDHAMIVVDFE